MAGTNASCTTSASWMGQGGQSPYDDRAHEPITPDAGKRSSRRPPSVFLALLSLGACVGDLTGTFDHGDTDLDVTTSEETCAAQCEVWAHCPAAPWGDDESACVGSCLAQVELVASEDRACFPAYAELMLCLSEYVTCEEWAAYLDSEGDSDSHRCAAEEYAYLICY